jgi:hypothetical protein
VTIRRHLLDIACSSRTQFVAMRRTLVGVGEGRNWMTRNALTMVALVGLCAPAGCYGGRDKVAGGAATDGSEAGDDGDGGSDDGGEPLGEPGERLDARVWRLSPAQFSNEVASLFGDGAPAATLPQGATEAGISGIASGDVIDIGNVSVVDDATRQIGAWAETSGAEISGCSDYGTPACIDEFVAGILPRAYRRPVGEDEIEAMRAVFDANEADHGYDYAFGSLVRATLLSPDFLYRTELGQPGHMGTVRLTDHEIAAAIAFSMTDRGPDAELLAAAEAGTLGDADERERHARRLMAVSAPLWQRLFREWLGLTLLPTAAEGSGVSDALVAQMQEEYATFVAEVVVNQRGTLEDLFTASYTWAEPELAALYGASHPGEGLARIELDPQQRAGLLTQAAWLSSHATVRDDYVVRRGMGIFRDAMCNAIVPPDDIDVNAENDELTEPDATVREVIEARAAEPVCGGCHAIPDPVGLAFEAYGNSGQLRTSYANGNPIESEADVPGIGLVTGGADLSRALVQSEDFQECFVRRFAHVFVGHDLGSVEWTDDALAALVAADLSLEEFLVAFVRHDAFIERYKGGQ